MEGYSNLIYTFPSCKINITTKQLVQLLQKTIDEITECPIEYGIQIYRSLRGILDLYLSIVPIFHISKLENVSNISILFHNDSYYLSFHLLFWQQKYKNK
jgi:hypothetical protein